MYYAMGKQLTTETASTLIEKIMRTLSPDEPQDQHKQYLAGYIDSLAETNQIPESTRERLYIVYGP